MAGTHVATHAKHPVLCQGFRSYRSFGLCPVSSSTALDDRSTAYLGLVP